MGYTFSAILIGQGGQGGGGGGGYYMIRDGSKPYYPGRQGGAGQAGSVMIIHNTLISTDKTFSITVAGSTTDSDNKGTTGYLNRTQGGPPGSPGGNGVNGTNTVLKVGGGTGTVTVAGGGGGGGPGAGAWYGYDEPYWNYNGRAMDDYNVAELDVNTNNYTPIALTGSPPPGGGGPGGYGGWGNAGGINWNPETKGHPLSGAPGGPGLCRIYWKKL